MKKSLKSSKILPRSDDFLCFLFPLDFSRVSVLIFRDIRYQASFPGTTINMKNINILKGGQYYLSWSFCSLTSSHCVSCSSPPSSCSDCSVLDSRLDSLLLANRACFSSQDVRRPKLSAFFTDFMALVLRQRLRSSTRGEIRKIKMYR